MNTFSNINFMLNYGKPKTVNDGNKLKYFADETMAYNTQMFDFSHNTFVAEGQDLKDYDPNSDLTRKYTVRITDVMNRMGVSPQKSDDWKGVVFKENFDNVPLGMKLRWGFENNCVNTWIITNTDNYPSLNSNVIARRCNQNLKRLDENGNVHIEPCVFDTYKTFQTRFFFHQDVTTINPDVVIFAQANDFTKSIRTNDRFIFGRGIEAQCFRIKEPFTFLLGETDNDSSVQFVSFIVERTQIDFERDDVENGVANANNVQKEESTTVTPTPIPPQEEGVRIVTTNITYINQYESNTITASVFDGGTDLGVPCLFTFSGPPKSYYKISCMTGNSFELLAMKPYNDLPLAVNIAANVNGNTLETTLNIWLKGT